MTLRASLSPGAVSLRLALVLAVIVPLAAAIGLTGSLILAFLEEKVERRMESDLELVARAIQLPLSHALEMDRQGSVILALESAFSIGRVYGAYVYDLHGRRIASAGRTEPDPQKDKLTELAADGENLGEYGHVAGRDVYSYFVPLTDSGGRVNGLLQLTRRESEFKEDIRAFRRTGIMGLGAGLLLMSGLVLFGHHHALGRALSELSVSMSQVAEGQKSHRIAPQGPREIAAIGRQFNHMLDSMDSAESELRRRRETQETLHAQLRQAEKLAAVGQLAAGVAHELGTPLGVVSGTAQRALRQTDLAPDVAGTLHGIRQEVLRMEHIIRQLLDFSRSSAVRKTPVVLSELAASSAGSVSHEAEKHDVQLVLAGLADSAVVRVDPVRMEQALVNLLRNAVQSAVAGRVELSWGCTDNRAWVRVDDDGPGIPEQIRNKVVEPFFTTKRVGEGTGLGLAVVHGILQEHEGELTFGRGSLGGAYFQIWLPADNKAQGA